MTYDTYAQSEDGSRPVQLFEFTGSGFSSVYYTSAASNKTIGATTYTAVAGLSAGETKDGLGSRKHDFTVTLPASDPVCQLFNGTPRGLLVRVVVKVYEADDTPTPEVLPVFDGFVFGPQLDAGGEIMILNCRVRISGSGKQLPRQTFRSSCGKTLYLCGVDDTDPAFRASALTVSSQVENLLTVSSGLSGIYADDWFRGGYVEEVATGDVRLIKQHTGNELTLQLPFRSTPASVNVFAGCDHNLDGDCANKFGNIANARGFPYMPKKNPFVSGVK